MNINIQTVLENEKITLYPLQEKAFEMLMPWLQIPKCCGFGAIK
jgi:hypothetical protein